MIALSTLLCLAAVLLASALGGYLLQRAEFYGKDSNE